MPRIISCSRRTDLPAFYTPWLVNRLRAGYCHTLNPFGGQVYRVSLLPEEVIAIIFWTRGPAPLIPYLDELDQRGYRYYFNLTVTGYPDVLESHAPGLQSTIRTFQELSDRLAPWRVQWRYDPVLLSSITPASDHLRRFEEIARQLQGYTEHCTFSFIDFYGKTRRNLAEVARRSGIQIYQPRLEEQQALAQQLSEIAAAYGMTLNACCNEAVVGGGVQKNRCIGPEMIQRLAPGLEALPDFKPTRAECGCLGSTDIGVYDTCLFGCAYCYATNSRSAAKARHAAHDPTDTILWRPPHLVGVDLNAVAQVRAQAAPKGQAVPKEQAAS